MPTTHTQSVPTLPTTAPAVLSLEVRLAAVEAAMTVALDEAAVAYEVRTAHIPTTPVDLADVVTLPLTPTLQPSSPYASPVAALLHRAQQRLLTDGWCAGSQVREDGARCLYGAIRVEAAADRSLEARGLEVLMDAIRSQFSDADSVPTFNDRWANGRVPMRILGQAAALAYNRGQ
ncbi:hypothetical protein AB0D68_25335 [Streptomyces sp. NPDC048212]|uniref:DUF6197 family protein n=1 Tax=Streptomyces TaxID=1883 RepID=UPI0022756550|nr:MULTISPECIES: hypothetical protein [Streptomyces]MCY1649326.1 hypothetical protein [Streptomyces sp. SL203]MCY1677038.1 hypothetical protein [Streptomyces sp. SL294]